MAFKQIHDLSKLDDAQIKQYLRDVSAFVKLDTDADLLDTIWMQNENGVGSSLVVYAKRGTAEILRDIHGVNVDSLTAELINGSIVFTAKGHNSDGRTEVATGSKYVSTLVGKAHDNAVMTASTRALRRLTMQFTGLGILDESEVHAVEPSTANPAANIVLAPSAPLPVVPPNPAPAKVVEVGLPPAYEAAQAAPPPGTFATNQAEHIAAAQAQANAKTAAKADKNPDIVSGLTPSEPTPASNPDISADKTSAPKAVRKPRKAKNAVSLGDVEPETVSTQVETAVPTQVTPAPPPAPAPVAVAAPTAPVAAPAALSNDFAGKPTDEKMKEYRTKVSSFTAELPASDGMGSVQKMRTFITHLSGTAPQYMTVDQWDEVLAWFDTTVTKGGMKGVVTYIEQSLAKK